MDLSVLKLFALGLGCRKVCKKTFANQDPWLALSIVSPGTVVNGITIDITKPSSPDAPGKSDTSFSSYCYKKVVPSKISGV